MRVTANQVTIARLLGLPLLAYLAYGGEQMRVLAVIVGTIIGLTDFVDGYLARKHGTTVLGSLLDPVADKVFIVVCYTSYADLGGIPWWLAAVILSRELLVTVLRSSLELRGRRLPSSVAGKAKTWVQMLGIAFVVLVAAMNPAYLPALFAVPLGAALLAIAIVRIVAHRRFRPIEFAALVLVGFLTAALFGPAAARVTVLGFVILITWYSAADYLTVAVPRAAQARRVPLAPLGPPGRRRPLADRRAGRHRPRSAPRDPDHHPALLRHGPRRPRQLLRPPRHHRFLLGRQPLGRGRPARRRACSARRTAASCRPSPCWSPSPKPFAAWPATCARLPAAPRRRASPPRPTARDGGAPG